MAFVAALVTDPMSVARRLGRILGANVTLLGEGLPADCPAATVDLGDCCLALYSLPPPERSAEIWGAVQRRPRVVGLGLAVDDLAGAEQALKTAGVVAHRRTVEGSLILGPGVLAFPVVLVDALLPGDPRTAPTGSDIYPELRQR